MVTVSNVLYSSPITTKRFKTNANEHSATLKELGSLAKLIAPDLSNAAVKLLLNHVKADGLLKITPDFKSDYRQSHLGDVTKILKEGEGIIEDLKNITSSNKIPEEKDVKETLAKLYEFLITLLTKINELNKEINNQVTIGEIVNVVKNVSPSTVMVEGNGVRGSGVIIKDNNGQRYIITNGHVVEGIDGIEDDFGDEEEEESDEPWLLNNNEPGTVPNIPSRPLPKPPRQTGIYHIKMYNGSDYKKPIEFDATQLVTLSGKKTYSNSSEHDLAVLKIPDNVKLPPELGVSMRDLTESPIQAGEGLIAIGNPLGQRDSISFGIASHTDRKSSLNINHHIQTDAAINPGNSGGGLFDMQGKLVGINTWGYSGGGGVGGSIRIDYVKMVLESWGIPVMSENEKKTLSVIAKA